MVCLRCIRGTKMYASPQQEAYRSDQGCDMYAWGVTALHLLFPDVVSSQWAQVPTPVARVSQHLLHMV